MKKITGFTLIEMVIVIILLGIMSAVSLPKYISFTKDANISVLQSMKATINFNADVVHLKAQIDGTLKCLSGGSSTEKDFVSLTGNQVCTDKNTIHEDLDLIKVTENAYPIAEYHGIGKTITDIKSSAYPDGSWIGSHDNSPKVYYVTFNDPIFDGLNNQKDILATIINTQCFIAYTADDTAVDDTFEINMTTTGC